MVKSIFKAQFMALGLLLIAAIAAQADELQCTPQSTATACLAHIEQEMNVLKALQAGQAPRFLDIAKNADGSPNFMTQSEAIAYCKDPNQVPQPAHLPSARELVQLSTSLGAKGIVDKCEGSDQKCYTISAINVDRSQDTFNFSYEGYQRPSGELGKNWFWSSSVYSYGSGLAYVLYGADGNVGNYYRGHSNSAVRCVSGR